MPLYRGPLSESQVQVAAEVWAQELNHHFRGCRRRRATCRLENTATPESPIDDLRRKRSLRCQRVPPGSSKPVRYCSTSSTRRFFARPSSVLLDATGASGPAPHPLSRAVLIP